MSISVNSVQSSHSFIHSFIFVLLLLFLDIVLQPPPPGFKWFSRLSSRVAGITGTRHHTWLIFVFLVETGFHYVGQASLELLTSRSTGLGLPKCWDLRSEPLCPANNNFFIIFLLEYKIFTEMCRKYKWRVSWIITKWTRNWMLSAPQDCPTQGSSPKIAPILISNPLG